MLYIFFIFIIKSDQAQVNECAVFLLSEDLHEGKTINAVAIKNPFS